MTSSGQKNNNRQAVKNNWFHHELNIQINGRSGPSAQVSFPSACKLLIFFLSNFPTPVLGISFTARYCLGSWYLANFVSRNSLNSVSDAVLPSLKTIQARGLSTHFSSGIEMTAASAT